MKFNVAPAIGTGSSGVAVFYPKHFTHTSSNVIAPGFILSGTLDLTNMKIDSVVAANASVCMRFCLSFQKFQIYSIHVTI